MPKFGYKVFLDLLFDYKYEYLIQIYRLRDYLNSSRSGIYRKY